MSQATGGNSKKLHMKKKSYNSAKKRTYKWISLARDKLDERKRDENTMQNKDTMHQRVCEFTK